MSTQQSKSAVSAADLKIRAPIPTDGVPLHDLVKRCKPLDENSIYCNLLHCSHFADTAAAAELDRELVGFVSGYRIPERPDTLFVWQVAVDDRARGMGLATRLIRSILARPANRDITHLETTITPDNVPSWSLFKGLARKLDAQVTETVMFDHKLHFHGRHDAEVLLRIGPFDSKEIKDKQ